MSAKVIAEIQGTPMECGADLFTRFVMPCLKATANRPKQEIADFYTGLLMATMGAMAADFGHANASELVQGITEAFHGMSDALKPQTKH